jgi:KAP family P-loop domain
VDGLDSAEQRKVLTVLETVHTLFSEPDAASIILYCIYHILRMIVIVDGLDSAEQRKVLTVLETVHTLFSEPGAAFIILLAVDPHIIAKAIESNLSNGSTSVAATAWIGGQAYLRNMVHLPFFLQARFLLENIQIFSCLK